MNVIHTGTLTATRIHAQLLLSAIGLITAALQAIYVC